LAELFERGRIPVLIARLAGAVVLGWLAMLTWNQIGFWRDTPTVWKHDLDVTGDNSDAHEHLSVYYHYHGQSDKAQFHGNEAHRIQLQRLNNSQP
jgi:hypothetical protein